MSRPFLRWALFIAIAIALWIAGLVIAWTVVEIRVPIELPRANVSGGSQFARFTGTWVIEGEKQAFPLQSMEVVCLKGQPECAVATAQVMGGSQLMLDTDQYAISSWENDRVVILDSSPGCVEYVYTIDLKTKAVNGIRRKKADTSNAIGDCIDLATDMAAPVAVSCRGEPRTR